MFEKEKEKVLTTALRLKEYRLIALSGGNVSLRIDDGHILVTPSGMDYSEMDASDICIVDIDGNVVEGTRRISVDTEALLYIYKNMPEVNAIIHTHQVYATAVGAVEDKLRSVVTTLPNATLGDVNVAPFSSAASLEMGINSVKYLDGKRAVILKNHGVVTVGSTIKEALYAAVYLEDAAKTYILAKAIGNPVLLDQAQVDQAVEVFTHYGQDKI
ncbi:L-ribulose-5-phosphate 4-epimerase [Clostridia bacterium]|nr:L-ribulose-5-phosphate 4-epimerase [Clostridia bacterium]